jgi:hypothetical protein
MRVRKGDLNSGPRSHTGLGKFRMSTQLYFPARCNNCRSTSKNRILARLSRSSIVFDVSVLNIHRALDLMKGQMEHCPSDFNVKRSIPPRKRLVYADIMSTIVANIAELQGLAGGLARTEPELSTPATLPLPNQGWPKMRNIRNLSSNSLTKALRATLGYPSHENIGPELEGTQFARSSHKENKHRYILQDKGRC